MAESTTARCALGNAQLLPRRHSCRTGEIEGAALLQDQGSRSSLESSQCQSALTGQRNQWPEVTEKTGTLPKGKQTHPCSYPFGSTQATSRPVGATSIEGEPSPHSLAFMSIILTTLLGIASSTEADVPWLRITTWVLSAIPGTQQHNGQWFQM